MHGFKLDVETMLLPPVLLCPESGQMHPWVGVDVEDLVFEALASSEACLTEMTKWPVQYWQTSRGTTDISVFKDGTIWHTAVVPVAGYQMTRDIPSV